MPVQLDCPGCGGERQVWKDGFLVDCPRCYGTGNVSVRLFDDTLRDFYAARTCKSCLQVGGMDATKYANAHPNGTSSGVTYTVSGNTYTDQSGFVAHAHEDECPCSGHASSERGDDADHNQRVSGRAAAAAFCGHPDPGYQGLRLDGPGEGLPTRVRGPVHSEPGASMNRDLERWDPWVNPTTAGERWNR